MTVEDLIATNDAPEWMTEEGYLTLARGYLAPGETPRVMYRRIADTAAGWQRDPPHWAARFFDAMWKGWLCPASPVLANLGTDRGLPISCYTIHVGDSVESIFGKNTELAMLSKNGGGVGIYLGDIRARGSKISTGGKSEGIVPWSRVYDTTTGAVSQTGVRRGASALYLPIDHPDIEEFLNLRRATGDIAARCFYTNHGVCVSDDWMKSMLAGDLAKRDVWERLLLSRFETGEPYIFFTDAVNRGTPATYVERGLRVSASNICTEICLYTDPDHTFVCCLSSLNLTKWEEWKSTDLVEVAIRFLDAVMSEFIEKASDRNGFDSAVRFARKGRPLGLGVLGWHTLLQERGVPFDSFDAMTLNAAIFRFVRDRADTATKDLADEFGEPEWCIGSGRRNTHTIAIAPTVSNSAIVGGVSAGVEPLAANVFAVKSAKGTFFRHNTTLAKALAAVGHDTPDTWGTIAANDGSVQSLPFLTSQQKEVFLTAREISQFALVRQASQRQAWIDQAQSVNLFFPRNADPRDIHRVHVEAWEGGMKTLYYLRAEGIIKGDSIYRQPDGCKACEG